MSQNITAFDAFCGAGGSSTGIAAAGVEVKHAANHWQLAIDTHSTNHPGTNHDCMDLRLAHPSMFPHTDIFWASPECTNHSLAKGRKRKNINQLDLWGEHNIDPAEERSRATMREVVEFTEYHRYQVVIVENVVDIRYWAHYDEWLQAMINLGYEYKSLYLNAMFFGVPQSRDRIYVVFWRKGNKAPDLDFRPYAYCIDHGVVGAVQSWKKAQQWGRYGKKRQYVYCCPQCGRILEPFTKPAADVIDWTIPSQRIGDRERPLKPKTLQRILEGLKRFAPEAMVVDSSYSHSDDHSKVRTVMQPFSTQTARQTLALVEPFLLSYMNQETPARSVNEALYTIAGRNTPPIITPPFLLQYYGREAERGFPISRLDEAIPVIRTQNTHALITPFIAEMHGTSGVRSVDDPLMAILGNGLHHALITPYLIALKDSTSMNRGYVPAPISLDDPLSTVVAAGSQHALITPFLTSTNHSDVRNVPVDLPMPAIMPHVRPSLVSFLMAYYGNAPTYAGARDPIPTVTGTERHALIRPEEMLDDCGFRMLEPEELKRGMSFPDSYIILGNKRDQVKQVGNAVCCSVAQAIVERCVASLSA